ncbi:MAG: MBOAT family O-acyltransferase, partial [Nitrospinota bacterium]
MIFPSFIFLFAFLPISLCIWLSRLTLRVRLFFLTLASYIFYGWWDFRFTGLLALSTLIDYWCGKNIFANNENDKIRKKYLYISITSNLSLLGFFKYFDFFIESFNTAFTFLNIQTHHLPLLHIILPVGISFYTFQSISYSVDIYRKEVEPAPDFLHFAAYVSLFPQLVAGPIVRYCDMARQLKNLKNKKVTLTEISYGTWYFFIGMSKKIVIDDNIA